MLQGHCYNAMCRDRKPKLVSIAAIEIEHNLEFAFQNEHGRLKADVWVIERKRRMNFLSTCSSSNKFLNEFPVQPDSSDLKRWSTADHLRYKQGQGVLDVWFHVLLWYTADILSYHVHIVVKLCHDLHLFVLFCLIFWHTRYRSGENSLSQWPRLQNPWEHVN